MRSTCLAIVAIVLLGSRIYDQAYDWYRNL